MQLEERWFLHWFGGFQIIMAVFSISNVIQVLFVPVTKTSPKEGIIGAISELGSNSQPFFY